jgi:hypothetical protein
MRARVSNHARREREPSGTDLAFKNGDGEQDEGNSSYRSEL